MKTLQSSAASFFRFLRDEQGATAIEYAMIAAGIGVAVASTVMAMGSKLNTMYDRVQSAWPS
jgi:pilus assembly protein Flp/PilA